MRLFSQRWRSDGSMKVCFCYCVIDVLLAIFVGLLCWLLFTGFVPPYKRGFYCNDHTIRLAFKPNTVSVELLLTVSIAGPIFLVIWYNAGIYLFTSNGGITKDKIRIFFATGTSICVEYFFGLMVVVALMHFGKSFFGVLRPHFLDVCRPNVSLITCESLRHIIKNEKRMDADDASFGRFDDVKKISMEESHFIKEPYCTTNNKMQLKVARESFPSGHTAVAVYALLFVSLFIHDRNIRFGNATLRFCPSIIKYLFLSIWTIWTIMVCITRITDHWHHWTDVVGGIILGIGVGAMLFFRNDSAFRNSLTQGKSVEY